jgi:hypothetical protein
MARTFDVEQSIRADRAFKAELQRTVPHGWETIDATRWLTWPFPRRTVEKIVQNR